MGLFDRLFGKKAAKVESKSEMGMAAGSGSVKDPVCGMQVHPSRAPAKSEYMGQTYYFCAESCKKAFDADPAKYLRGQA